MYLSKRVIDKKLAQSFAENDVRRLSLRGTSLPSQSQILHTTRHMRNSTPGIDGLPAIAWMSEAGAQTLFLLQCNIFCGVHPPVHFSDAVVVFPPKKISEKLGEKSFARRMRLDL